LTVLDPAASSPFNDGFEFLSGGGGLVSTVRDYANFCQMLVDGGLFKGRRLLKEETL
jgi:CubicO group peptidase (beta-lactamase class C family)